MIKKSNTVMTMMREFMEVPLSLVTPVVVSPQEWVRVLSRARPLTMSHLPNNNDPPHAIVNNIIVLPASVPTPTATYSAASSLGPNPDTTIMMESGNAPNNGNNNPPINPGLRTSNNNSLPLDKKLAPYNMINAYTIIKKMIVPMSLSEHGRIP